jgi:hypothetical protein
VPIRARELAAWVASAFNAWNQVAASSRTASSESRPAGHCQLACRCGPVAQPADVVVELDDHDGRSHAPMRRPDGPATSNSSRGGIG